MERKQIRPIPAEKIRLMLDSGAFSVWTRGKEIDLDKYIDFIHRNKSILYSYVNLDVLPGKPGATRTPKQVEEAAEKGWKNFVRMKKAGLDPIHVFHQGERRYWLEKMLGEGIPYIGLSPNINLPTAQKKHWLDEQFSYLCGTSGYPPVKVHGFGMTAVSLIHRYPWFTTDSSTWLVGSKTGSCMIPHPKPDGSYDYARRPLMVKFAETKWGQDAVDVETGSGHYISLSGKMRAYVDTYLKGAGFDLERLRKEYGYRTQVNARFFRKVAETHPNAPYRARFSSLFKPECCKGARTSPIGIYQAVMVNTVTNGFCDALVAEKMRYHLLSYEDVRNRTDLPHYVRTWYFVIKRPFKVIKAKKKGLMT